MDYLYSWWGPPSTDPRDAGAGPSGTDKVSANNDSEALEKARQSKPGATIYWMHAIHHQVEIS